MAAFVGLVVCYGLLALAWPAQPEDADGAASTGLRGSDAHSSSAAGRKLLNEDSNYPPYLFTQEQRENGAVVLHFVGVVYMFLGLAIVCDEYFVPALEVITDRVGVSDDVAGATFMAAGGSAPELFTSYIGVFVSKSDVGFGTIVGSAVFNVLFVIGMCAVFSKEILALTWWPLFRDATYYCFSLIVLVICFWDQTIELGEALVLFAMYFGYVLLMKFNVQLYNAVNRCKSGRKVKPTGTAINGIVDASHRTVITPKGSVRELVEVPSGSINVMRVPRTFRVGVMHMLVQHVDAKGKGPNVHVDKRFQRVQQLVRDNIRLRKAMKHHKEAFGAAATAAVRRNSHSSMTDPDKKQAPVALPEVHRSTLDPLDPLPGSPSAAKPTTAEGEVQPFDGTPADAGTGGASTPKRIAADPFPPVTMETPNPEGDEDDDEDTADVHWPTNGTVREKVFYVLLAPLSYALYFTVPDVRKERWENWYPLSFIMSIVWIGIFSYFMVWFATTIGAVIGIPDPVMGLTFLAAGTSIPDLLSSVIVARQGAGDMAVSSSIGSNIFDILVGLPLPWLTSILILGEPVKVASGSLVFSVMILVIMLILVIATIALSKWRMTKTLGMTMFGLYAVFVALSLLIEYDIIEPPSLR